LNSLRSAQVPSTEGLAGFWRHIFVFGVSLLLVVRLFRLVSHYAVNIFFSDQWDFDDATLFQKHTLWEMFRWQHGPHRQGLGAVISRLLEPHFGWNSRAEAFLATAIVVAAALCAFYLKTKLFGPISFWDVTIPLIFFAPAQFETLWVTPNLAHGPLPLLLVILYCLALTSERTSTRYILILVINFVAIYTGFTLFLGLLTPGLLLIDWYLIRKARGSPYIALFSVALSLISLGSFFVGYKYWPAADCFSSRPLSPVRYLIFMDGMLAHNLGARGPQIISIPLGTAALVAMFFILARVRKRWKESQSYKATDLVPAVLVGYAVVFCAAAAYGRTCLGTHVAFDSRYTEYVALGFLGIYFYFIGLKGGRPRTILTALLLTALLIGTLRISREDRYGMEYYRAIKSAWRSCYLRIEDIHQCDQEAGFGINPWPEVTNLKGKLEFLKQTKQNLYSALASR
jgi:hypothetical protein